LVEGSLASAFAKRRGEDVRQLVAMMVSIGRSGTVEKLYNAARLAPLQVPCEPSNMNPLHKSWLQLFSGCQLDEITPMLPVQTGWTNLACQV
jgi:hypothetical protein